MNEMPLITEEILATYSRDDLVKIVMRLQQLALIQDDQLAVMKEMIAVQAEAVAAYLGIKGESKE